MALDLSKPFFSLSHTCSFGPNPDFHYKEFCWLLEFPSNLIICVFIHTHTHTHNPNLCFLLFSQ